MTTIDHITNGEIQLEIGGKLRTLKFSMLANKLIGSQIDKMDTSYDVLAATVWAGLMVRASVNDLPAVFDLEMALEWADQLNEEDLATILAVSERAREREKNVNGRVNALLGRDEDGKPLTIGSKSKSPLTK